MIELLACMVICAVANRLRGGWLKDLGLTTSTNVGRFSGAALVAGVIFWLTASLMAAAVLTAFIFLGWQWGWTKWITGITHRLTQDEYNRRFAYPLEVDEPKYEGLMQYVITDRENYIPYVWVGMTLRGLIWWAPVFAASWYMDWTTAVTSIVATAFLSIMFPVVYWLADDHRLLGRYLVTAEPAYGAVFGLALWWSL